MPSSIRSRSRTPVSKVLAATIGACATVGMVVLGTVSTLPNGNGPGLSEAAGPPAMSTGSTTTVAYSAPSVSGVASPTLRAKYFGGLEP